jgi:hypothetical protein
MHLRDALCVYLRVVKVNLYHVRWEEGTERKKEKMVVLAREGEGEGSGGG